jgi:hypothetical protein
MDGFKKRKSDASYFGNAEKTEAGPKMRGTYSRRIRSTEDIKLNLIALN